MFMKPDSEYGVRGFAHGVLPRFVSYLFQIHAASVY
jgi:hypothetical protein